MSSPSSSPAGLPTEVPDAGDLFTYVSTFAGTGGSSLGYRMAGGEGLLAVEWDDHAAECYRLNFPDTPLHHGDVTEISAADVLERTGLEAGELDLFDGSPPCQGFSSSGKRRLDDPRNTLFMDYARLLEGLQPRAFVMENVSGMVKGKMRVVFAEVLRTLRGCGYRVSARLMNAKWYGVPQSRERMIFVGVREDLGIRPSHPAGCEGRRPPAGRRSRGFRRTPSALSGTSAIGSGRERSPTSGGATTTRRGTGSTPSRSTRTVRRRRFSPRTASAAAARRRPTGGTPARSTSRR